MFFWNKKRVEPDSGIRTIRQLSDEDILKEAYRIGKFSPSNCECPPAPNIIPFWVNNNVEAFGIPIERFFSEVDVPQEVLPKFYLTLFKGFRDLILSCPDEGDSPFCLSHKEVIEISKKIFIDLAQQKGIDLTIPG